MMLYCIIKDVWASEIRGGKLTAFKTSRPRTDQAGDGAAVRAPVTGAFQRAG
jgi:hypothetical protein